MRAASAGRTSISGGAWRNGGAIDHGFLVLLGWGRWIPRRFYTTRGPHLRIFDDTDGC
jgi:hypothetical protein